LLSLRERSDAWFPFAGHVIKGLYNTARTIELAARQRESLVTLGTIAAGLAHEINNPAAAATRAIDALEDACHAALVARQAAQDEISSRQFRALDALRREIEPRAAVLDPLAMADHEEALSSWLSRHGVERDWIIAPPLAAAGVDLDWCERAATVLDAAALAPGLEWVASTLSVATLLSEPTASRARW